MRIQYWDIFEKQLPRLWTGSNTIDGEGFQKVWKPPQLIRVKGYKHTDDRLRYISQVAYEHPDHTFMVFSIDVNSFKDIYFSENVLPVLQVNSRKTYTYNIDTYNELCVERGVKCPTLSIFCNHTINISKHIKWLILSGDNYDVLHNTIAVNYTKRQQKIPVYVEEYNYNASIPNEFRIRQIPKELIRTEANYDTAA